ncbi:MAG: lysoplasmalogenase [Acidimicrobiia bacterium]
MNAAAATFLVIAGICAFADWYAVARPSKTLEYVAKPATLAALIVVALLLDPVDDAQRAWFVVALVFSLGGDVFLMLPRDLFVAGLASFLVGHLAYVVGINLTGGDALDVLVAAVVVVAVAAPLALKIVRSVVAVDTKLVGPVVVYILAITAMVVSAVAAGIAWMILGAVLFYASDALIAWNRFVRPAAWMPVAIIVTYHLGQAGLTLGLLG